ncbi:sarcosine oxidase subunit delta [Burkholderia thailandensis]|nr:sarcosine oxidase subunit delta [Burkholderia thailandensis]
MEREADHVARCGLAAPRRTPASMPRRASRGTAGIRRCSAPGAQPRVSIQFRAQRAEWRTASSSL